MTHKEVLKRLAKLQASAEGEAAVGNATAAQAFAALINKMMLDYELSESDLEYAKTLDDDPIIEFPVNLGTYKIRIQRTRIAWQEQLASIVAKANMCTFLIRTKSNSIWFVGTQSHVTVAEYTYGTLVPIIDKLSDQEYYAFLAKCQREGRSWMAHGYRPAWLNSFMQRIEERFFEARKAAVAEAPNQSTALMRINTALVKAQGYIDIKYKGKTSAAVNGKRDYNAAGRADGRAAANRIPLDRRGVDGGKSKNLIQS
jgi:hypothetical protein